VLLGVAIREIGKNREMIDRLKKKKVRLFPFDIINTGFAAPIVLQNDHIVCVDQAARKRES
jgi:hypothetical protein